MNALAEFDPIGHRAKITLGRIAFALGAIGLGALGFAVGDLSLQPDHSSAPWRAPVTYLSASALILFGAGLLVDRFKSLCAAGLAATFLAWPLVLHGPRVIAAPLSVGPWLGFCEFLSVSTGALSFTASRSANAFFAKWGAIVARALFGACLPVFGWSHFAYIEITADVWVPDWMPAPVFWAVFIGACHAAAGISILTNVLAGLASFLFAVMISSIALLVHVPRVVGDPSNLSEWTMLAVATAMAGAAWFVAARLASVRQAT